MRSIVFIILFSFFSCYGGQENPPDIKIQLGDLQNGRGQHFHYMKGDLIDCKNVTVDYLEGNVRGVKSRVLVTTMKGNVESGVVNVNVLIGDIIEGENVTVNVLDGRDFSEKAKVAKNIRNPSQLNESQSAP